MIDQFIMMNLDKKRDPEMLKEIEDKNLFNQKLNYNNADIELILN